MEPDHAERLASALQWLLDDLTDAGENRDGDHSEEYDSVANARATLKEWEDRAN